MRRNTYSTVMTILIIAMAVALLTACDTTDTSDYFGPRVYITIPADRAEGVSPETSISVRFNEPIMASTVTAETFIVRDVSGSMANISGAISVGTTTAVFVPDVPLSPETAYMVSLVPTISDVHNNYMSTGYSWHFITGSAIHAFDTFSPAGRVIGQAGFTTAGAGLSADMLNAPGGAPYVHNSMLYIPDTLNNRVLGFLNVPGADGTAADFALGQTDLISAGAGNAPSALNSPSAVHIAGGRTFVADTLNNRVLIWNSVAITNAAIADIAAGQPGLYDNAAGCSAHLLNGPSALAVAGGKLLVSDTLNNRVLIWDNIPAVSNTPADMVLGQGMFNSCAARSPVGADTLNRPGGVWSDGARLAVADSDNNRVLIWKNFPAVSNTPADIVLGQPDMAGSTAYVSALDMNIPTGVSVSTDNKFYVVDAGNSRVMVWNRFPTGNYQPADAVLGQAAFYLNSCNTGGLSDRTLCSPEGVQAFGIGNIVVTDTGNNRALIYNAP
jgi:hypothetical protein